MLVLSRKPKEKIFFPTLGVTVEVCSVKGNVVRLGIDAPPSVPIVREEIAKSTQYVSERHRLRNRLHTACLAVHLAQRQLQAGLDKDAGKTLDSALRDFSALEQELAATGGSPKREIRALLVEDNGNESALLAEFLRLHGVKVETACDGQDALDYLQSHDRPDVILIDMRMPRCDGPTTVAAIRRNAAYEGLKVFAVSGADPSECSIDPGSQGIDRWFTKPVNPKNLVDELHLSLN
ncbi:MAG TPA: response regulator [Gemmataceae bacterium]|nr:response regulator [Gemmataceae bacterium]